MEAFRCPRKINREEGICLTWKDVWMAASNRKSGSISILKGLTGYAKLGQLLAIMGPSGCGKSTLRRLSSNTRQTGEILINGHKQSLAYGTSAYVTQDDTLLTTLTVREAVHYSQSEKKERADFTIREMGLQDAINTRIGGRGSKGASGVQLPTRRIATLAQNDHIQRTVIASIHQLSSEVFQLLNNLCLLSSGKTVYFGPASAANEVLLQCLCSFSLQINGFPCPVLMNPSDNLMKTMNKFFDQDIEVGLLGIEKYPQKKQSASFSIEWKRGHAGFFNQCLVLTERSFANMYRDLGYYWLQFAIFVALAIALATIFCDLGTSYGSVQDPGSLIAFINGFLTFMTIGGFPSFVEVMKNEFEGLRFASNEVGGGYISGEDILRNTWQVDTSYSKWVDLAILIGMIVVYRVLFLVIIKIKEKMKPVVVSLSCMSASSKRTIQVMENPNATPLH
ncbi:ABC transporter G family member 11 [Glycine soja]